MSTRYYFAPMAAFLALKGHKYRATQPAGATDALGWVEWFSDADLKVFEARPGVTALGTAAHHVPNPPVSLPVPTITAGATRVTPTVAEIAEHNGLPIQF